MNAQSGPRTNRIVSITPLPLEADSRTLRIATSFGRAGYASTVIEGGCSAQRDWGSGIELVSLGAPAAPGGVTGKPSRRRLTGALRAGRLGVPGGLLWLGALALRHALRYRLAPRGRIPPADLYYLHSFEYAEAVLPLAGAAGAPIVYDAHDFYSGIEPADARPCMDRRFTMPFLEKLERRLVDVADAVVTVSPGVADLFENAFGRRPQVIRNCHDDRLDIEPPSTLKQRLGLGSEDVLMVVVGNWKPGMAVEALVNSLSLLPRHVHLAFLGRGYEAVQPWAASVAGERVHMGLVVDPRQVVPTIRDADIGLVAYEPRSANYTHALPNGFFQVVAAGLPLVYPQLPQIAAAVAGRGTGIGLDRIEPGCVAEAVLRLLDPQARFPARQAAVSLAQELRWDMEERPLIDLVRTLIDSRSGPLQLSPATADDSAVTP